MTKPNLIYLTFIILSLFSFVHTEQLKIANVDRQVILNSAYPTEQTLISFKSQGNVNIFKYLIPIKIDQRINKIAFMKSRENKQLLSYTREQYIYDGEKYALYRIELEREFYQGESGEIYVVIVFLNRYVNFPQEITMNEDQKFQYKDTKYLVSPYTVEKQSNTYKFDKILSNDKDGQLKGLSTVVFKKGNLQPFQLQYTIIHGVNNDPQVYISNIQRTIQISHWGNIGITQFYKLQNIGPSLKGEFSRVTFGSQSQADAKNSFKGIQTTYPYQTWGLYYRDQVGNISTSKAYRDDHQNKVRAAFVPRFSLLGGWKANWEIGYNLPTKNYLYSSGNSFQIDNIDLQYSLEKIIAENYDIKITLPEGSSNVKVKFGGFEIKPNRIQKSYGYLDFFGRPTYVFQNYKGILKRKQITVDYESSTIAILYKPLVLFAILFSILSVFIVLKRLTLEAFKEETKLKQN